MWRIKDEKVVKEYRKGKYIYLERYKVEEGEEKIND